MDRLLYNPPLLLLISRPFLFCDASKSFRAVRVSWPFAVLFFLVDLRSIAFQQWQEGDLFNDPILVSLTFSLSPSFPSPLIRSWTHSQTSAVFFRLTPPPPLPYHTSLKNHVFIFCFPRNRGTNRFILKLFFRTSQEHLFSPSCHSNCSPCTSKHTVVMSFCWFPVPVINSSPALSVHFPLFLWIENNAQRTWVQMSRGRNSWQRFELLFIDTFLASLALCLAGSSILLAWRW